MKSICLNGAYTLSFADEQLYPVGQEGLRTIPAVVPGNVEIDLMREGILPDIFFGNNVKLLREYEFYRWIYTRSFTAPKLQKGQRAFLRFEGVDCVADYTLNGTKFAHSENALIAHRFDVTELLTEGENTLSVEIHSPILESAKKPLEANVSALVGGMEALRIRKAPSGYGWDIMPRTVSAGLWRAVYLDIEEASEFTQLYVATVSASEKKARLTCMYSFHTDVLHYAGLTVRLTLSLGGKTVLQQEEAARFVTGKATLDVANPQLWWPRGYGDRPIYTLKAELLKDEKVLAETETTLGIRTIKLDRTDITDVHGGEFRFLVNGTPIFCKGSNWVPADAMHSRDASRYEKMLSMFADTNCNILRCWGGNVYEDHAFFDICDREGFLVWQDFTMACAAYPLDESFLNVIREEAECVVTKLRNHPSLAMWSGDNECDTCGSYLSNGIDPNVNRLTREVLPQVIIRLDPFRSFLPSSPYITTQAFNLRKGNSYDALEDLMPEQHLWGPRDYYKSSYYTNTTAHFASETGYHGCNSLSSMRNFLHEDKLWPWQGNDEWLTHAAEMYGEKGPYSYRIKLMSDQIHEMFGHDAENLEDFILASQISQAEAKKFFIELPRCKKWRRTGVIWWNMIDGWLQFSDAVVSYDYIKKLAYHYIKRSQQDVCLMITEPEGWHVRLMAGNDTLKPHTGTCRVWDGDTGEVLYEGAFTAGANSTQEVTPIRVSHGDQRLFLMEWTLEDGTRGVNHYVLGKPPLSFERYKVWLKAIAALDNAFACEEVGK